jgi:SAM-dependent methyltransferase
MIMNRLRLQLWLALQKTIRPVTFFVHLRSQVARRVFHVNIVSRLHDHIWDETSLVLLKALHKYVRDGHRVLDLGTGDLGLLAIHCAKARMVQMVAVDTNECFVANARRVAESNGAMEIDFRQSDWFSSVDGVFDVIFSNIPYVPTELGKQGKHFPDYPELRDGGSDGCLHARTILRDVRRFLSPDGLLLLGANAIYIPREATLRLIEEAPGLSLRHIITSKISPSEVYEIASN